MDPTQVWTVLRQNWKTLIWISALFFVGIVAMTMLARMDFHSRGRLYLGEVEGTKSSSREGELDFAGNDDAELGSEIELIRSESLITAAVLESGLNTTVAPSDIKPPRYWRWRLSGRDSKLIDAAAEQITVKHARLADDGLGLQDYKIRFTSSERYELWLGDSKLGEGDLDRDQSFQDVTLNVSLVDRFRPVPETVYDVRVLPLDETVEEALKKLTITYPKAVSPGEPIRVLVLEYTHRSPHLAAGFLRSLMTGYLSERQGWKVAAASAAETFLAEQLRSLRESMDRTELSLAQYRSTNRAVVMDSEAKALIEQIGKYEEQRVNARLQVSALADMKRALQDPNTHMEAFLLGEAKDTVLEDLASRLSDSRQELASIQQKYQLDSAEVRQKQAQVDSQMGMVRNYITDRLSRAQDSLSSFSQIIAQFETRLKAVPAAELGLVQLSRESEVYRKTYSYLLERQQQAAITKATTVSRNRILDLPKVPRRESSPSLLVRMPLSLAGLAIGLLIVLARHLFSSKLETELDARILCGQSQVLASLPTMEHARLHDTRRARTGELLNETARSSTGTFAEAVRMLRTKVYQRARTPGCQVLLFTSPIPGDGKTTTALSLSVTLAADGKNVLLIDADLRKPSHHELLDRPMAPGLSSILSRKFDWRDAVYPIAADGLEFYSLSAGEPGAVALLSGDGFSQLIQSARLRFDFIVIDSASFPLVSDCLSLAPHADLIVSVLKLHHTPRRIAAEHLSELSRTASNHTVVINGTAVGTSYGNASGYTKSGPRGGPMGRPRVVS